MLGALAPDDIWRQISWQGTEQKVSFSEALSAFLTAIKKVSRESLTECDSKHCESKIKTFLRHTEERLKRREKKNASDAAS